MTEIFSREFARLNPAQKEAVETIEGPLMVIAGPGTGKTQLLSLRVANILNTVDIEPQNILCLTFTDNAARNMRERLETIIGKSAYHVSIHTFHSFGSDVISNQADYFVSRRLLQQIDELGRYEILRNLFERLDYDNFLSTKVNEDFIFLKDTLDIISWLKQNALSPDELDKLLDQNLKTIDKLNPLVSDTFSQTPASKHIKSYLTLLEAAKPLDITPQSLVGFKPLIQTFVSSLSGAIELLDTKKTNAKSITSWRNTWCMKNSEGHYVLKDSGRNFSKFSTLAQLYRDYALEMNKKGLFDFDDMIGETLKAINEVPELKYQLQEKYQYILVDEFQDTNKAQLGLLNVLADNPIFEGRPNIMVVGDDDQAIYSFQGADASNMSMFLSLFPTTRIVNLSENYRSTERVINASYAVADQISDRLVNLVPEARRKLEANRRHKTDILMHNQFVSELAQYAATAEQIGSLIKNGALPKEIAVISPRHRYLERIVPYLREKDIPLSYERRENILDSPLVIELTRMSELIVKLAMGELSDIDHLLAEVLNYEFWQLDRRTLVELSLRSYREHKTWLELLSASRQKPLAQIMNWLLELAKKSRLEPLEYMLDQMIGGISKSQIGLLSEHDEIIASRSVESNKFISPFREYYFNSTSYKQSTDIYLALLGQLSTLRQSIRQWQPDKRLYLSDFIEFVELHKRAGIKIIDDNPHTQSTNAVQLLTAYKAKGLEFDVVFIINAQDEVWGTTARSRLNSIRLPINLPIAPSGNYDNDKLRLLFVALTRARHSLYISSYKQTLDNKLSPGLSYLIDESSKPIDLNFEPILSGKTTTPKAVEILSTDWAYRYRQLIVDRPGLFEPILKDYKLSVTHLNNFLDIVNGGPSYFLVNNLLRFPHASSLSASYGDVIHKTLLYAHLELRSKGHLPGIKLILENYNDLLFRKQLSAADHRLLVKRGEQALTLYFSARGKQLSPNDLIEKGFSNEGVLIGKAHLSGKIDKIQYVSPAEIKVVDFKTGKPAGSWKASDRFEAVKLHKYRQQLIFYKLLIENSATFAKKAIVSSAALEFIEADKSGKLLADLELSYSQDDVDHLKKLVEAVWRRINALDFPITENYPKSLEGIIKFENDLINQAI